MKLILSRHGNTFDPNDPVVWAGSKNDFPLVAQGIEQAELFADVLQFNGVALDKIFCGPLQRTVQYSSIIIKKLCLNLQAQIDFRLNEIDYGEWSGLTHLEVTQRFGQQVVHNWMEHSVWPESGNWGSSERALKQEVHAFVRDLIQTYRNNETILVVTSNGRLRFFLSLITEEWEKRKKCGTFKVKTGNICKLVYIKNEFELEYWNQKPTLSFVL